MPDNRTPPDPNATPPPPGRAPPPPGRERPPAGSAFAALLQSIENAVRGGDIWTRIAAFQYFAGQPIAGTGQQLWNELYNSLRGAIGGYFGVPGSTLNTGSIPILNLYRDVFLNVNILQRELGSLQGDPSDALKQQYRNWVFAVNELASMVSRTGGGRLFDAVAADMREAQSTFHFINQTFSGFGVSIGTGPEVPPAPGENGTPAPGGGDFSISFPDFGGFSPSRTVVTEELRPPTAQEFLLDFDNAFLRVLGRDVNSLTPDEKLTLQNRRNELIAQYVARLGKFAEQGESPFVGSTRSGEVQSESSTEQDASGGTVTHITQHGVETTGPTGQAAAFLIPKITPIQFLTELFPTPTALKMFAEGPNPAESRLPSSGFVGSTQFQRGT